MPKDLRAMPGNRTEDQMLEQKMFLVLLSLRKYKGFRSSVPGGGQRPVQRFSIISHTVGVAH